MIASPCRFAASLRPSGRRRATAGALSFPLISIMAITRGPLHSDSARGSIGKQLTFRRHPRGTVVTKYSFPGSVNSFTPSAEQELVRTRTKEIMQAWPLLSPEEQASWIPPSMIEGVQPINSFFALNFERLSAGLEIAISYPPPLPSSLIQIYTPGSSILDIEQCTASFIGDGALSVDGSNNVFSTPNLESLILPPFIALDGVVSLVGFASLVSLDFSSVTLSAPPIISDCPALAYLIADSCGLSSTPDISTLSGLAQLLLTNNAFSDVDQMLIQFASSSPTNLSGFINLSGGSSVSPTSASLDARSFLTSDPYSWSIVAN